MAGLLRLGLPLSSWLFSSDEQKRLAHIIAACSMVGAGRTHPAPTTTEHTMKLSSTQSATLSALRAKKARGLAEMHDAERSSYNGLGLTKTERAEMIGALVCSGSVIAGCHIPGASYRTLLALVAKGAAKSHRAKNGRVIVYAA